MSATSRWRSAAPLVRPLRESLSDFAGAKSRDRAGPLMRTFYTGHIPETPAPSRAFPISLREIPVPGGALMSTF